MTIIDIGMFGNDHHHNFKTLASFLVVVFAFALFAVLYQYGMSIINQDNVTLLILLIGSLFALLLALVYFINKPNPHTGSKKSSKSAKKKKTRK